MFFILFYFNYYLLLKILYTANQVFFIHYYKFVVDYVLLLKPIPFSIQLIQRDSFVLELRNTFSHEIFIMDHKNV